MARTFVQSAAIAALAVYSLVGPSSATTSDVQIKPRAALVVPSVANWTYSGCYTDDVNSRSLISVYGGSTPITDEFCMSYCGQNGYHYAGTEYSTQCYCGGELASTAVKSPNTDCNMACQGNATEACGGPSRLTVFYNPNGPQTNIGPGKWGSMGCYTDNGGARTLLVGTAVPGGATNMTVAQCTTACQGASYMYAGVEYSQECYCGNAFSNGGAPASDSTGCSMTCSGNSSEYCGGPNRLNVYGFGFPKPATGSSSTVSSYTTTTTTLTSALSLASSTVSTTSTSSVSPSSISTASSSSSTPSSSSSSAVSSTRSSTSPAVATSTAASGSPVVAITAWTRLGCYTDSVAARTLGNVFSNGVPGGYTNMTIEGCQAICKANGYTLSGTEYAQECYCDNSLLNGGALATDGDTGCNMACLGNSAENCGGGNRLNMFSYKAATNGAPSSVSSSTAPATTATTATTPAKGTSTTPTTTAIPTLLCPGSNGAIFTAGSDTYKVECYIDHQGGDLSMVYTPTLNDCLNTCEATAGCIDVSWVPGNPGPCYMKSAVGGGATNSGVWGGLKQSRTATAATSSTSSVSSSTRPTVSTTTSVASSSSSSSTPASSSSQSASSSSTTSSQSASSSSTTSSKPSSSSSTGSSASASASVTPGWRLIGCYTDSVAARTLSVPMAVMGGPANLTTENCQIACKAGGYALAGTEYSQECYCDNSFRNGGGPAPDGFALCSMTCNGNTAENCGGSNRLNMYQYFGNGATVSTASVPTTTAKGVATTTASSAATGIPSGWAYYGCYVDNANGRILPQVNDLTTQTVESCIATCISAGNTIAAVEYASQCFCGNAIQNGGALAASDSECNMACSGNSAEKCGAGNRMNLYSTGPPQVYQIPAAQLTGIGNWTYQGCVTDDPNNRTLAFETIFETNNSAPLCLALCQSYGYMAAGLEYGNQCFCGDSSTVATSSSKFAPESDCNTPCPGNLTTVCGAGNRINYYTHSGTPLYQWNYASGIAAGVYQFLIGGLVVPLITSQAINGKVTFLEKSGTGPPNSTGAYELDLALVSQGIDAAWRTMHVKTDIFCSAGLTLPDKVGRQINIGGWSGDSTYGVRLYWPDGSPGQPSVHDWQENETEVHLQLGRWYPSAMIMSNGSILVVGGESGSNGPPVPSLEILPNPVGGAYVTLDFLQQTDPYNLYPFLYVLPSGKIFIAYWKYARLMDPVTFATTDILPIMPGHILNPKAGRTYPFEGTSMLMPQHAPYTDPVTILICGGSTPNNQALDNCVSIQPDVAGAQWVLERMPSPRVISCMTALPDGTYLILNGALEGQAGFGLASRGNYNAILYDPSQPVGARMTVMANTTIARLYHSEAILLADGRVLVSGSDPEVPGVLIQEYRVEVFIPPYLLAGNPKPTFKMSSTDWAYGQTVTFSVTTPNGGAIRISLLGAESSTHGNSMGARTIFPDIRCAGGSCTLTAPPNNKVCPPGWFQVFVLDGPTPSVSQYVRIGGDPASLGNWPAGLQDFLVPGV